ncbi:MAG: hypothetical protein JXA74_10725 [Anaerolineae bacterium]|nr:hypothetical protein [Anaerolineae bacterium]
MQAILQMINMMRSARVDMTTLAMLAIFFPFFILFTLRARHGHRFTLRSIRAYEEIEQLASQAAESGQPLHVSLGRGQIGSESTPEALMGLGVFHYVCRSAAQYDQAVFASLGDPTLLGVAQGMLQRARQEAGFPEHYTGRQISFYGPDPFAYAAGTRAEIAQHGPLANLLVGHWEAEGLWLSEASRQEGVRQLGGTSDPAASALLYTSLEHVVVGEDLFAAGGYLGRVAHVGSLAAQDLVRILVMLSIVAGVILASLGYWG